MRRISGDYFQPLPFWIFTYDGFLSAPVQSATQMTSTRTNRDYLNFTFIMVNVIFVTDTNNSSTCKETTTFLYNVRRTGSHWGQIRSYDVQHTEGEKLLNPLPYPILPRNGFVYSVKLTRTDSCLFCDQCAYSNIGKRIEIQTTCSDVTVAEHSV